MEEAQAVASSTWNSSMASSSGNCSGQGDLFTSLLLQLSQAHTSQIQKLEHRVETLQKKCSKLASIANENADVARAYRVHNKELKEENAKLQQQLAELKGQRVGIREENESSGSDQGDDVAVLVTQPAQATITSNHRVHPCQQSQSQNQRPNKLTKGKSKKKIRYTEVDDPSAEAPRGEIIQDRCISLQDEERRNTNCQQYNRRNVKITQNKVQESDISGEPRLTDELLDQNRHNERCESKSARILVPETCNPSLEMESSIDGSDSKPNAGGDNRHVKKRAHLPAIPETLAIIGENQNGMESLDNSDFDPPTCASTPLQAPFSQRIDLETLSSQLQGVSRDQGSPEFKETRDEIEVDRNLRTKSNLELNKDNVTHQHDETRYASQEKRQRKSRTSLPKSESQYPVDFSSTQVPSPTFCGGNNDDDDEDVGIGNIDNDDLHVPVIKEENIDIKTTPVHESRNSHSRYRTPQSILGNDESCLSEASLLLLQAPHVTATPKGSNAKETPESNIATPATGSNWKANPRKRKFHEDIHELEAENNQTLENNEDFENNHNFDNRLRRVSSRSKADQERSTTCDETYLDVSVPDKENSPPKRTTLPQTSNDDQDLGFTAEPGKLKVKGGKMLKQSKLTPSMFQSSSRTHNISLIEQYNGNGKVNVDSQRDESLAKAVELSLLASMGSFKSTQGSRSLPGDQQDEFKVPVLPHRKKTPGRTDKGLPRSESIKQQVSSKERGSTSEHSPGGHLSSSAAENVLESDDIIFDVIDRGGGISKLSRKKRKTVGRSATREDTRNRRQKAEEVREVVPADEEDEDNNSCVDMFGDEDVVDDEKEGGVLMEDAADERRMPGTSNYHDRANNQSMGTLQIVQEFDRLPSKPEGPGYKYIDIVRKKEERQKLKAFDCKQCEAFYRDMKLTDEEKAERMKACSRHRGQFSPPSTPDHYWSIGFPDTQTCLQRGYIKLAESPDEQPRKRRTNKYKQLF